LPIACFELLPRLEAIHSQRLYRPDNSASYPQLAPVLSRAINGELITQQYDQMVQYVTALSLGTADTEDILRRFRRSDVKHPVYRAPRGPGQSDQNDFSVSISELDGTEAGDQRGLNVIGNWRQ
jgi:TnpA family transposase